MLLQHQRKKEGKVKPWALKLLYPERQKQQSQKPALSGNKSSTHDPVAARSGRRPRTHPCSVIHSPLPAHTACITRMETQRGSTVYTLQGHQGLGL